MYVLGLQMPSDGKLDRAEDKYLCEQFIALCEQDTETALLMITLCAQDSLLQIYIPVSGFKMADAFR